MAGGGEWEHDCNSIRQSTGWRPYIQQNKTLQKLENTTFAAEQQKSWAAAVLVAGQWQAKDNICALHKWLVEHHIKCMGGEHDDFLCCISPVNACMSSVLA